MKLRSLTIVQRLVLTNLVSLLIISCVIVLVTRSLTYIEDAFKTQLSSHIEVLTINSRVSRGVILLTSRAKLLEQNFLFNESILVEEEFKIDQKLQELRELPTDDIFSSKMDTFIDNFHRFLGNSLALNRILKQIETTDTDLADGLDKLELAVAEKILADMTSFGVTQRNVEFELLTMIRESYLSVGKMVGSIHSRITPETEKVLLIEVIKELDIFSLHLDRLEPSTEDIALYKKTLSRSIIKYRATLRRIRANLDQRWSVMNDLIDSQNALLHMVEVTEDGIQGEVLALSQQLESEIRGARKSTLIFGFIAFVLSVLLVNRVVQKHIQKPLKALSIGFEDQGAGGMNKPIQLGRKDEWSYIENAYNKMARRLTEVYDDLNKEKKKFDFLAHHDPLTGLANRLLANEVLCKRIKSSGPNNGTFLVLYLDIDEFKTINDSLGHTTGDTLLKNVSKTLLVLIKDRGFVARMGGDEFMIILNNNEDMNAGITLAQQLNDALRSPYSVGQGTVFVSTSIGICEFPRHGHDDVMLVRNADTAMYHAKRNGKDQYKVYEDRMTLEMTDLIETKAGLRRAIEKDEFVIHFQPKVDLTNNTISGAEALIRWQHPTLGLLPPGDFLQVAEQTDLIIEIDMWVFKKVANYVTEWQKLGLLSESIPISVNFSARMFYRTDLAGQLQALLDGTDCKPEQLLLEITERDMMRNFSTCEKTIKSLQQQGYKIAIDDFGTGYSSLSVLRRLSVDYLKLDRSFIQDMNTSKQDFEITNTILKLASVLDLSVVAEGVETKEQLDTLKSIGCRRAQGFYFSKPLPVDQWLNILKEDT